MPCVRRDFGSLLPRCQQRPQMPGPLGRAQLPQRLRLNLPDALALAADAEPQPDHLLLRSPCPRATPPSGPLSDRPARIRRRGPRAFPATPDRAKWSSASGPSPPECPCAGARGAQELGRALVHAHRNADGARLVGEVLVGDLTAIRHWRIIRARGTDRDLDLHQADHESAERQGVCDIPGQTRGKSGSRRGDQRWPRGG